MALRMPSAADAVADRLLLDALAPTPRLIRQPGAYQYALGPYVAPIAAVAPGETVVVETVDCFGDCLTREDQLPSAVIGPHLNPQTGPIWVEGAEPGDTLVVRIEAIAATRDWAISCLLPYCGGLTGTHETPTLQAQLEERVWIYRRTRSGGFAWRGEWEVPCAPALCPRQ
jgi:acetamidase/formamidase